MKRSATAVWRGSGDKGNGTITSESKALNNTTYSFRTRFTDVEGTSPEELLAAAHASCFSMKLSFVLGNDGFTPDPIETTCTITIDDGVITNSHLVVKAKVADVSPEKFKQAAEDARANCPVSQLFSAKITMDAQLL